MGSLNRYGAVEAYGFAYSAFPSDPLVCSLERYGPVEAFGVAYSRFSV